MAAIESDEFESTSSGSIIDAVFPAASRSCHQLDSVHSTSQVTLCADDVINMAATTYNGNTSSQIREAPEIFQNY